MKNFYFMMALICSFSAIKTTAQKVKFENETCIVQKVRLPDFYSEPDERTYDVITKGYYGEHLEPYSKRLYGWEPNPDNPTVTAVVSIYGYTVGKPKKHSKKKEKKDKEGKVTDRWTEYWYTNTATGKGTLYVYGVDEEFEYSKRERKKSKWEEKQDAKAEAEKKELEDNVFLTEEVIAEAEESDIRTDSGLDDSSIALVKRINIDNKIEVKTNRNRSSSKAYREYQDRERPQLLAYRDNYPYEAYKDAINHFNRLYGFTPVNKRFNLKSIKGDKHPESKMWNDACKAAATIFKTFRYNESIDKMQEQFNPILEYFVNQVKAIPDDDKKRAKQKKYAYQNLLNIFFYLDRHEDAISWSNQFLESKKLDKVAKKMIAKSDKVKAHLAFHKMNSCHNISNEEVDAEDIEMEELSEEDEEE